MHRGSIKSQAADELSRLEKGDTDNTELHDVLSEILKSIIEHLGEINDDHEGNPELFCICQEFNDTVETANSTLPEVSAIAHDTTKHGATE